MFSMRNLDASWGVHLKIVGFDLRRRSQGSARTLRCQNEAKSEVTADHTRPQSSSAAMRPQSQARSGRSPLF